ncbi:MAG: PIN domain-containing protein [Defluviitaleaceae bacterium]|nr:PIN domain-containing protein [Defluviitaleaceae bacterium]
MSGKAFYDTNIMIYLYADSEPEKQEICKRMIDMADECVVSTQILNEINNVMFKKWGLLVETVTKVQSDIRKICKITYINEAIIDSAIDLYKRYGFSYYDCLMLASALDNGCNVIYTEDMNDGQTINGTLTIINPFKRRKP